MHMSDAEKLEIERVGRTTGLSAWVAYDWNAWSLRGSMGVEHPASSSNPIAADIVAGQRLPLQVCKKLVMAIPCLFCVGVHCMLSAV